MIDFSFSGQDAVAVQHATHPPQLEAVLRREAFPGRVHPEADRPVPEEL